jgi:hypothetical protein
MVTQLATATSPFSGAIVTLVTLRDELQAAADRRHAGDPLYADHFEGWGLGLARADLGADAVEAVKGEYVLLAPRGYRGGGRMVFYSQRLGTLCQTSGGLRRIEEMRLLLVPREDLRVEADEARAKAAAARAAGDLGAARYHDGNASGLEAQIAQGDPNHHYHRTPTGLYEQCATAACLAGRPDPMLPHFGAVAAAGVVGDE